MIKKQLRHSEKIQLRACSSLGTKIAAYYESQIFTFRLKIKKTKNEMKRNFKFIFFLENAFLASVGCQDTDCT